MAAASGRVTNNETKLNNKVPPSPRCFKLCSLTSFLRGQGEREHLTSIIEYRDNKGERHTIRSSRERFVSEQVDVCYELSQPTSAWVCQDGVTDGTAVGLGVASVLSLALGGSCVYAWTKI